MAGTVACIALVTRERNPEIKCGRGGNKRTNNHTVNHNMNYYTNYETDCGEIRDINHVIIRVAFCVIFPGKECRKNANQCHALKLYENNLEHKSEA